MSNSGCSIKIDNNIVCKKSGGLCSPSRLIIQMQKQVKFNTDEKITTPKILSSSIEMEEIKGPRADKYIIENSYESIIYYFSSLLELIKNNLLCSTESIINTKIFSLKLKDIANKTGINLCNKIESHDIIVPIGDCHGDLTTSNMIWSDKIYLFDFLDNEIETPLWDIAKLRQDIKYGWFIRNKNADINGKLNELNQKLELKFEKYERYFRLFDFMVLARILPYVDNEDKKWLLSKLEKIDVRF